MNKVIQTYQDEQAVAYAAYQKQTRAGMLAGVIVLQVSTRKYVVAKIQNSIHFDGVSIPCFVPVSANLDFVEARKQAETLRKTIEEEKQPDPLLSKTNLIKACVNALEAQETLAKHLDGCVDCGCRMDCEEGDNLRTKAERTRNDALGFAKAYGY